MSVIKNLTRKLETQPNEKNLRAWFLNGCKNTTLTYAEISNPRTKFDDLVA